MSVSLHITWADGRKDILLVGTQQTVERGWRPLARQLGLHYVPLFPTALAVDADNLTPILAELELLRAAMAVKGESWALELSRVVGLIASLNQLVGSEGWRASIG